MLTYALGRGPGTLRPTCCKLNLSPVGGERLPVLPAGARNCGEPAFRDAPWRGSESRAATNGRFGWRKAVITGKHLARRTFLRGLGAAIALPLLDAMTPAFAAASRLGAANAPRRMAFVYVPNGIIMKDWTPAAEGAAFELPRILKPLEPYREQRDGALRPDAQHRPRAGRWSRRPCPRRRQFPDRRASQEDRGRRHSRRHLGGPDRRAEDRQRHTLRFARTGLRRRPAGRQLRFRLQLRLQQQHLLAHRHPRRCRRRSIRARCSSACSAMPSETPEARAKRLSL